MSRIGLGSVGLEILCLRVEEVLERGSEVTELKRGLEALRPNHFAGLFHIWAIPVPEDGDGEGERGKGWA